MGDNVLATSSSAPAAASSEIVASAERNPGRLGRAMRRLSKDFKRHPVYFQSAAVLGWIILLYGLTMGGLNWIYSRDIDKLLESFISVLSVPLNIYLDLPRWLGLPIGTLASISCLIGGWTIVHPLFPDRKPSVRTRQPDAPMLDTLSFDAYENSGPGESPKEIPEHIRQLVTRFVDLQTLQPVGVLRSILVIMESDVEAYRHLLTTHLGARSLERLRQIPPGFFGDAHCQQALADEDSGMIYAKLGLTLDALAPTLVERIEGEQKKTPSPENTN